MNKIIEYIYYKCFKSVPPIQSTDDGEALVKYLKYNPKLINSKRIYYGKKQYSTNGVYIYEAIRFEKIKLLEFLIDSPYIDKEREYPIDRLRLDFNYKIENALDVCILWKRWEMIELLSDKITGYNNKNRIPIETLSLIFYSMNSEGLSLRSFLKYIEKCFYKLDSKEIINIMCFLSVNARRGSSYPFRIHLKNEDINYISSFHSNKEAIEVFNTLKHCIYPDDSKTLVRGIKKINFKESLVSDI